MHLEYYNRPKLQLRVVRILWMVPIYAVDSWLSLRFKEARWAGGRAGGRGRWGRWGALVVVCGAGGRVCLLHGAGGGSSSSMRGGPGGSLRPQQRALRHGLPCPPSRSPHLITSILAPAIRFYIDPIRECYEAFVIYQFFAYLVAYLEDEYGDIAGEGCW